MRDRRLVYALIGLLFFFIGIVIYLPASVATGWVAAKSPLRFDGVTGTLLNGKAAYVSWPDGGLENLAWRVHPARLLLANVAASVKVDTDLGGLSGQISHSLFGANKMRDLSGDATIGWFAKLGGYTFVPVSGRIAPHIDRLDFNDNLKISALAGQIAVTEARYELANPAVPLGQFRGKLSQSDDGALHLAIADSQGPLILDGSADLTAAQRYVLDMRLRARAGADDRLKTLLKQLGRPGPDGWYPVRERGRL